MVIKRKRLAARAVSVALLCAQVSFGQIALAQSVPINPETPAPSSTMLPAADLQVLTPGGVTSFTQEITNTTPVPPVSTGPTAAVPVPVNLSTITANAVVNSVTSVIDISQLATPGALSYSGNFQNTGNLYLVSTSSAVTTATISAQNLVNSGLITTVLPQSGLPGYSGALSSVNLVFNVSDTLFNAGTISSSGSLTATAANIVNALPAGMTGPAPVMQSVGDLSLITSNITNSGVLQSLANINLASSVASTINVYNVNGILQAANAINVRDAAFAGKFDTRITGGDVLADVLNIHSGDGIVSMAVGELQPVLNIFCGEAYVDASSNIRVSNIIASGDPVVRADNGDIIFTPDPDTQTATVGNTIMSGVNALSAGVTTINAQNLQLTLSGNALLDGVNINSQQNVFIDAAGAIQTGNVSSGLALVLRSPAGNITAGNLSAGVQIHVETLGSIEVGDASGQGVFLRAGQGLTAGVLSSSLASGFIDLTSNGAGGNSAMVIGDTIAGINMTARNAVVLRNGGTGGIVIAPGAMSIGLAQILSVDAGAGSITFQPGDIEMESALVVLAAGSVIGAGTTLSSNDSLSGFGGNVLVGANNINVGSGLTLHADGDNGLVWLSGRGSTFVFSSLVSNPGFSQYSFGGGFGNNGSSMSVTGSGPLTASANGNTGNVFVLGNTVNLASGTTTLTANGAASGNGGTVLVNGNTVNLAGGVTTFTANASGSGSGGRVSLRGGAINNTSSSVQLAANGSGSGSGGLIELGTSNIGANINIGANLGLSATGGDGGTVTVNSSGNITADSSKLSVLATGANGNGGALVLNANGTISFSGPVAISADGNGSGNGGFVRLTALGPTADLNIGGSAGQVSVSARGGNGGTILLQTARTLTVNGALSADGTTGGFGVVELDAGFGAAAGNININESVTAKSANSFGGLISVNSFNSDVNIAAGKEVSATGANGGTVIIKSGRNLNVNGATVSASGTQQFAGAVQIESTTTNGSVSVGTGSTIAASGNNGSIKVIHRGGTAIQVAAGAKVEAPGNVAGEAGTIEFSNPVDNVRVNIAGTVGSRTNDTQDIARFTTTRGVFVEGSGTILGQVASDGAASISIAIGQANRDLQIGVVRSSGNAFIATTSESSMGIVIPASGSSGEHSIESTTGDVELQSSVIENNSLVKASAAVKLTGRGTSLTVKGAGEFRATTAINVPASVFGTLDVTIGDGQRNLRLISPTINIVAKNNLTINGTQSVAILDASGTGGSPGGNISLNTEGRISVVGKVTADGGAGIISITSSNSSLDLSAANITANGGAVIGDGGAITITGATQVTLPAVALSANGGSSGSGGTIRVTGQSLGFSGPLMANAGTTGDGGTIVINSSGSQALSIGNGLSVNSGTSGAGGNLFVTSGGDLIYSGPSDLSGHGDSSNGGTLFLHAGGVLTLAAPSATFKVDAAGDATGGAIDLAGTTITSQASLTLTANGGSSILGDRIGNGGTISLRTTGGDLSFGTGGSAAVIAANGGTNGGRINLTSSANLSVGTDLGVAGKNGSINMSAANTLTIDAHTVSAVNDGQVTMRAPIILLRADVIQVTGTGTGSTGLISIESTDAGSALTIQSGTTLAANGTGTISLKSAGDIVVNGKISGGTNATVKLEHSSAAQAAATLVTGEIKAGEVNLIGPADTTVNISGVGSINANNLVKVNSQGTLTVVNDGALSAGPTGTIELFSAKTIDFHGAAAPTGEITAIAQGTPPAGTDSVNIKLSEFTIGGIVAAGSVTLEGESITNNGTVSATGNKISLTSSNTGNLILKQGTETSTFVGSAVEVAATDGFTLENVHNFQTPSLKIATNNFVNNGSITASIAAIAIEQGSGSSVDFTSGSGQGQGVIVGNTITVGSEQNTTDNINFHGAIAAFQASSTNIFAKSITVESGAELSTNRGLSITTDLLTNTGIIRVQSGSTLTLVSANSLNVTNAGLSTAGRLLADNVSITANQSVDIKQAEISGVVSGTAGDSFTVKGASKIGIIRAEAGSIMILQNGVTLMRGAVLAAPTNGHSIQIGTVLQTGNNDSTAFHITRLGSGTGTVSSDGSVFNSLPTDPSTITVGDGAAVSLSGGITLQGGNQLFAGAPEVLPASGPGASQFASGHNNNPHAQGSVPPGPPNLQQAPGLNNPGQNQNMQPPGKQLNEQGNPGQKKKAMNLDSPDTELALSEGGNLTPVSYVAASISGYTLKQSKLASATLWSSEKTKLTQSASGQIVVQNGETVVWTEATLELIVGDVRLTAAPKTAFIVKKMGDAVCVFNLHDTHKGSLKFSARGSSRVSLEVGHMLAYGTETPSGQPAYRHAERVPEKNGWICEYSLTALLRQGGPLTLVSLCSDTQAQKLTAQVMKTRVIFDLLTSTHGKFSEN